MRRHPLLTRESIKCLKSLMQFFILPAWHAGQWTKEERAGFNPAELPRKKNLRKEKHKKEKPKKEELEKNLRKKNLRKKNRLANVR